MTAHEPTARAAGAMLLVGALAMLPAAAGDRSMPPGFVDGSKLIELAGEDALTVEISLHGALLRAITRAEKELEEVAGGLESIHAVILDLENVKSGAEILEVVEEMQRDLRGRGWERLARMKESDSVVNVLVLNDAETIQGLVVLVVNQEDQQVIFANVAGVLDLAAIEKLGDELDIPGLDDLD